MEQGQEKKNVRADDEVGVLFSSKEGDKFDWSGRVVCKCPDCGAEGRVNVVGFNFIQQRNQMPAVSIRKSYWQPPTDRAAAPPQRKSNDEVGDDGVPF